MVKILITADNEFTGDNLDVGRYYNVEPADTGTLAQNATFHALLQEYWRSACHSYNAKNFEHFRLLIKLYLGAGTENYYDLIDDNGKLFDEPVLKHRVKSWKKYTKKERMECIDRLIAEMYQVGVQSEKFNEIIRGLER